MSPEPRPLYSPLQCVRRLREGREGAPPQVINRSAEPARVLIFSSDSSLTVVHYPDSGKVGFRARSGGQGALLPRERELDYREGEA